MSKEKRYAVTIDFYVWSESDEEAKKEAERITKELDDKYDNMSAILEIGERETTNYRKLK